MKNIVRAFVLVLAATGYVSFAHGTSSNHTLTSSHSVCPVPRPPAPTLN